MPRGSPVADARWRRLTDRIAKGLLLEDPSRVDPFWRQEAWEVAGLVAELLSLSGPAWTVSELELDPLELSRLGDLGLAASWADPDGGGSWVALTQRAADLGKRVPSSDGGLRDPEVSRSVAIGRDKPEGAVEYARKLASLAGKPGQAGFFAQARWAS